MVVKERRLGVPRSDIERAMSHYGITETEYLSNPSKYPLPERGVGLTTGTAAGSSSSVGVGLGGLILFGLLIWGLTRKK